MNQSEAAIKEFFYFAADQTDVFTLWRGKSDKLSFSIITRFHWKVYRK